MMREAETEDVLVLLGASVGLMITSISLCVWSGQHLAALGCAVLSIGSLALVRRFR